MTTTRNIQTGDPCPKCGQSVYQRLEENELICYVCPDGHAWNDQTEIIVDALLGYDE